MSAQPHNPNPRTYSRSITFSTAERIFRAALIFATSVLLARHLGPLQYGAYATAVSVVYLLSSTCNLGIAGTLSHSAALGAGNRLLLWVVALRGVTGLAVAIALLPLLLRPLDLPNKSYWIMSAALTLFSLEAADYFLQGRRKFVVLALTKSIAVAATCALAVWMAWHKHGVEWLLAVRFMEWPLTALLLALAGAFRVSERSQSLRDSAGEAISLVKRSAPLIIATLSAAIYLRIDQVMIAWLIGPSEVAHYAIAAQFSEAWYLLPIAISAVLLPMLTELRSSNLERYRAELERWSRIFVYTSIVVAVLITIVATPLIQILFGSEYTAAAGILKIHVWAGVFMSFRILMSKWIIMEDIIAISLKTQLLGMISNIALNFVLIPAYGGEGAAVATLVGYAMASYIGLKVWPESRPAAAMFEQAFTWPAKLLRGASRKRYE